MQENPIISDWVPVSGGSTEGSLGGWLAQRQAALRDVMAAGHFQPLLWVFRACRFSLEQLACQGESFLELPRNSELELFCSLRADLSLRGEVSI
jgi:hypothetical protein